MYDNCVQTSSSTSINNTHNGRLEGILLGKVHFDDKLAAGVGRLGRSQDGDFPLENVLRFNLGNVVEGFFFEFGTFLTRGTSVRGEEAGVRKKSPAWVHRRRGMTLLRLVGFLPLRVDETFCGASYVYVTRFKNYEYWMY